MLYNVNIKTIVKHDFIVKAVAAILLTDHVDPIDKYIFDFDVDLNKVVPGDEEGMLLKINNVNNLTTRKTKKHLILSGTP